MPPPPARAQFILLAVAQVEPSYSSVIPAAGDGEGDSPPKVTAAY